MLELYYQDPDKWKEVLLLYLGLNKNKAHADAILKQLIEDFEKDMNSGTKPNLILFPALTQCAVPDPELASDILNMAKQSLEVNPEVEIIEELGFIAANPRWASAKKAKEILVEMSGRQLPNEAFQQMIFSLLHAGGEDIDELVMENLKRIDLAEFLSRISVKDKSFINKLFSTNLSMEDKRNLIEGLKEAGNFEILGHLMMENKDREIREIAAYKLLWMSKLDGFYNFLDNTDIGYMDKETEMMIDDKFKEWGWRWELPSTENGKKMAVLICFLAASEFKKRLNIKTFLKKLDVKQIDNRLRYLTTACLVEKGVPFQNFNLIGFGMNATATKYGLKKWWKKDKNIDNFWYRLCGLEFADVPFWGIIFMGVSLCITITGVISIIQYLFGFTSNWLYRFLFDLFTLKVIALYFGLSSVLSIFVNLIFKRDWEEGLILALFGLPCISADLSTISKFPKRLLFLLSGFFIILGIGILFVPFHNYLLNVLLFLSFFLGGFIQLDSEITGSGSFFTKSIISIQNLLHNKD
jgi:hypothetical protein